MLNRENWQQHNEQARRNLDFAQSFDWATTPYRDWVVSGIYYTALHKFEAYLAAVHNEHPLHNCDRAEILRRDEFDQIRKALKDLKNYSQNARYNFQLFTLADVQAMIDNELRTIEEWLRINTFEDDTEYV